MELGIVAVADAGLGEGANLVDEVEDPGVLHGVEALEGVEEQRDGVGGACLESGRVGHAPVGRRAAGGLRCEGAGVRPPLIPVAEAEQAGDLIDEVVFAARRAVVLVGERFHLPGELEGRGGGVERREIRRPTDKAVDEDGHGPVHHVVEPDQGGRDDGAVFRLEAHRRGVVCLEDQRAELRLPQLLHLGDPLFDQDVQRVVEQQGQATEDKPWKVRVLSGKPVPTLRPYLGKEGTLNEVEMRSLADRIEAHSRKVEDA